MLTGKSSQDLALIARNGGSFVIDGSHYSTQDLAMIARNGTDRSVITLMNSSSRSTSDLAIIARNSPGTVVFS